MKKVIKKISAIAMAFTLLGTGTAAVKTFNPKSDNTLVASAGMPPQYCQHNHGTHMSYVGNWYPSNWVFKNNRVVGVYESRARANYCNDCGSYISDAYNDVRYRAL